ncbi:hypothetical protein [Croceicoccus bisphenolivorans]|uniref:hypothetical protein n=1 Tax=Croceicoccus bisphenolivorans TaxID=1783232 RepID=UPI000AD778AE|nr:hypothetical protein [Croceicoccus bisphenolivorans]
MPLRITMHRSNNDDPLEWVCLGDLAEAITVTSEALQAGDCVAAQVWSSDGQLLHEDAKLG